MYLLSLLLTFYIIDDNNNNSNKSCVCACFRVFVVNRHTDNDRLLLAPSVSSAQSWQTSVWWWCHWRLCTETTLKCQHSPLTDPGSDVGVWYFSQLTRLNWSECSCVDVCDVCDVLDMGLLTSVSAGCRENDVTSETSLWQSEKPTTSSGAPCDLPHQQFPRSLWKNKKE